jgi:hypothetical protein
MTQALYAHMNNKRKRKKKISAPTQRSGTGHNVFPQQWWFKQV